VAPDMKQHRLDSRFEKNIIIFLIIAAQTFDPVFGSAFLFSASLLRPDEDIQE
jgi:uncharacterized metal-binding protein